MMKFNIFEYKKEVLGKCSNLKYMEDNLSIPIHYSNDLTVKQRQERRELVAKLRERQNNNENNLVIRNGQIVTVPTTFQKGAQRSLKQSWADLFK